MTLEPALLARRPSRAQAGALRWLEREHARAGMAVNGFLEATRLLQIGVHGGSSGVAKPRSGMPAGTYQLTVVSNSPTPEQWKECERARRALRKARGPDLAPMPR